MTSGTPEHVEIKLKLLGDLWRLAGRHQNSADGTARSIGDSAYTRALVAQKEILADYAALAHRVEQLEAALVGMVNRYVGLVECGDCGNWDAEKEPEVIAARAALSGGAP